MYALRSTSRATAVSASMTTAGAACSAVKENNARYLGGECHYGSRAQSASQSARDTLEATLVTAATARSSNGAISSGLLSTSPRLPRPTHGAWTMTQEAYSAQQTGDAFFTVFDRRIRKRTRGRQVSPYTLAREWMQNDPESQQQHRPPPQRHLTFPEPLPKALSLHLPQRRMLRRAVSPIAKEIWTNKDHPTLPVETLLENHIERWKDVKRQVVAAGELDMERYEHRLLALVPAGRELSEAPTPIKLDL